MSTLSEKLGAVVERLDGVREDFREHRAETKKELQALRQDIHALQSERDRGKGWLTGASAAIALIFSILTFLLHGCAAVDPAPACSAPSRWGQPPIVVVEPEMPEACRAQIDYALELFRENGKPLVVEAQPQEWLGFEEWIVPGRIVFVYRAQSRVQNAAGLTIKVHWGDVDGPLKFAFVELTECDNADTVAAHELGHALGLGSCPGELGHHHSYSNLMFPIAVGGFELTAEQKAWIQ